MCIVQRWAIYCFHYRIVSLLKSVSNYCFRRFVFFSLVRKNRVYMFRSVNCCCCYCCYRLNKHISLGLDRTQLFSVLLFFLCASLSFVICFCSLRMDFGWSSTVVYCIGVGVCCVSQVRSIVFVTANISIYLHREWFTTIFFPCVVSLLVHGVRIGLKTYNFSRSLTLSKKRVSVAFILDKKNNTDEIELVPLCRRNIQTVKGILQ